MIPTIQVLVEENGEKLAMGEGLAVELSGIDLSRLADAVELLEHPTVGDKLAGLVGRPLDKALRALPKRMQTGINTATERAVQKALEFVLWSVDTTKVGKPSADKTHKALAAGAGFAGGLAGGWGVLFELPFSTAIMLRTIADIARSEGEDLSIPEARLACVEVLALDTTHPDGKGASLGAYYGLRRALDAAVAEALLYLAGQAGSITASEAAATSGVTAGMTGFGVAARSARQAVETGVQATSRKAAPALVHLAQRIAERYGLAVSEQVAAQLMPIIGGIGGATVNLVFTDHFQRIAHGHFIVRRLERSYGAETVARAYQRIRRGSQAQTVLSLAAGGSPS